MAGDVLGIRINVDFEAFGTVNAKLEKLINDLKNNKKNNLMLNIDQASLNKMQSQLNELQKKMKESADSTQKQINQSYAKIKTFDKAKLDSEGITYLKGTKDIVEKVQKLYGSMGEVKTDTTKNIKGQIDSITATVTKADGIVEKYKMNLATISQNGRNYSGFVTTGSKTTDNTQAQAEAQLKQVQSTNQAITREQEKQIANADKLIQQEQIRVEKLGTLKNAIPTNLFARSDAEVKQYIKSLSEANSKITNFQRTTDSLGNSQIKVTVNTKNASNEIQRERIVLDQTTNSAYRNGEALRSNTARMVGFSDKFRIALQSITLWFGATALVYGAIHKFTEGVTIINTLNKSMTNIQMITGMTAVEVQKLTQEYSQLAGTLHETTTEIMTASEEFLRAGHNQEETAKLIVSSTLMSKIAGQDQKSSADQLIAITNAYKLSATEALSVVDKLVMVDNTSATSTMELGQALERSSASAQMAQVSFSQLVSYIGTVSSVTRKSAESIGESFKTIFARFQDVKGGKQFDADNDPLSNVERDMNKMGIAIRKSKGEFKSFNDVITELSVKWSTMSQVEQSTVAKSLAGVRQRENFLVLMNNTSMALGMQSKQLDSTGNALKRYQDYSKSTEARVADLQNSIQQFWMKTLQSSTINSFLSGLTGLIKGIERVTQALGGLGTAALLFGNIISIVLVEKVGKLIIELGSFGSAMTKIGTGLIGMLNPINLIVIGIIALSVAFVTFINQQQKVKQESIATAKAMDEFKTASEGFHNTLDPKKVEDEATAIEHLKKALNYDDAVKKIEEYKKKIEALQSGITKDKSLGYDTSVKTDALKMYQDLLKEQEDKVGKVTKTEKEYNNAKIESNALDYESAISITKVAVQKVQLAMENVKLAKSYESVYNKLTQGKKLTDEEVALNDRLIQQYPQHVQLIDKKNKILGVNYTALTNTVAIQEKLARAEYASYTVSISKDLEATKTLLDGSTKRIESLSNEIETLMTLKEAYSLHDPSGGINAGLDAQLANLHKELEVERLKQLKLKAGADALGSASTMSFDDWAKANGVGGYMPPKGKTKTTGTGGADKQAPEALLQKDRYQSLNSELAKTNALIEENKNLQTDASYSNKLKLLDQEIKLLEIKKKNMQDINAEEKKELSEVSAKIKSAVGSTDSNAISDKLNSLTDTLNSHKADKDKTVYNSIKSQLDDLKTLNERFNTLSLSTIKFKGDLSGVSGEISKINNDKVTVRFDESTKNLKSFDDALTSLDDKLKNIDSNNFLGQRNIISAEITKTVEEIAKAKKDLANIEASATPSEKKTDTYKEDLAKAKQNILDKQNSLDAYSKAIDETKTKEITKSFSDANDKLKLFDDEIKRLGDSFNLLDTNDFDGKIANIGEQAKTTTKDLTQATKDLADFQKKFNNGRNLTPTQLTEYNNGVSDYQNRIASDKSNLKSDKDNIISARFDKANESIKPLSDEISLLDNKLSLLDTNDYLNKGLILSDKANETRKSLDEYNKQIADIEKNATSADLASTLWNNNLVVLKKSASDAEVSLSGINKEIKNTSMEGIIFSSDKAIKIVQSSVQDLEDSLSTLDQKDLEGKSKLINAKIEQLKKEQILAKEKYDKIFTEANSDGVVSDTEQTQVDNAKDAWDALGVTIHSVNEELKNLELDKLKKQFDDNAKVIDNFNSQIDLLKTKLQSLENVNPQDFLGMKSINQEIYNADSNLVSTLSSQADDLRNKLTTAVGEDSWKLISDELNKVNSEIEKNILDQEAQQKAIFNNSISANKKSIESLLYNGSTSDIENQKYEDKIKYQQTYIVGQEKSLTIDNLKYQIQQDINNSISDTAKIALQSQLAQLDLLNAQDKLSRETLDRFKKQYEIKQLELKLDNLKNNKTIQQLTKDSSGQWQYQYVADQEAIAQTTQDLSQKKLDLLNWENDQVNKLDKENLDNKTKYLDELGKITEKALNGQYATQQDYEKAIEDLNLKYRNNNNSSWASVVTTITDSNGKFVGQFASIETSYSTFTTNMNNLATTLSQQLAKANQDIIDSLNSLASAVQKLKDLNAQKEAEQAKLNSLGVGTGSVDAGSNNNNSNITSGNNSNGQTTPPSGGLDFSHGIVDGQIPTIVNNNVVVSPTPDITTKEAQIMQETGWAAIKEMLKQQGVLGFKSGGYTGDGEGMAMLHSKELVLDKIDTTNILKAVDITKNISSWLQNFKVPEIGTLANKNSENSGQTFYIDKLEFPNANNATEIRNAILSLPSLSLQKAKQY